MSGDGDVFINGGSDGTIIGNEGDRLKGEATLLDAISGLKMAIETIGGKPRILTDSNITSVNIPNGQDPIPDTFFTITAAGAIGDTVRVQIAATSIDTTSPNRNILAVDVTTTLTSSEVGDELALKNLIISNLNSDSAFQDALLEAKSPAGDLRAIVYIFSTEQSMSGEFAERPNAGDVSVSVTGTTTISIDTASEKLISRAKPSSLAQDPANPHRLGVLGISGSVFITAQRVKNYFSTKVTDSGGSADMTVDGSSTPVVFTIDADPTVDTVVTEIRLTGQDGNINFDRFFDRTTTNGMLFELTTDGDTVVFDPFKTTLDVILLFSNGGIDTSFLDTKKAIFTFRPPNPFMLNAGSSDKIKFTIRDNWAGMVALSASANGFRS